MKKKLIELYSMFSPFCTYLLPEPRLWKAIRSMFEMIPSGNALPSSLLAHFLNRNRERGVSVATSTLHTFKLINYRKRHAERTESTEEVASVVWVSAYERRKKYELNWKVRDSNTHKSNCINVTRNIFDRRRLKWLKKKKKLVIYGQNNADN